MQDDGRCPKTWPRGDHVAHEYLHKCSRSHKGLDNLTKVTLTVSLPREICWPQIGPVKLNPNNYISSTVTQVPAAVVSHDDLKCKHVSAGSSITSQE